ncbi:MAG: helix-turn-helix transcriptional regulator [Clostridiales bacterium]|nr:helix-turn-helix transcriptional regulator [Clostridiales bacterium]
MNSIQVQVGNSIRKHREGRCLSQEEMATRCNISRAYFGRIERGEYNVTISKCKSISDALGIALAVLFEDVI